jgi:uncharacterized protein (TIGR02996 family)
MSDGDSLYRAILINPADNGPRLIYADWLEEHGDLERAELIRLMVHFPRDRARYRPPRSGSVYWPDAPGWITYEVRRGFVAEIGCPTELFLAHAGDLFARHPITRVQLSVRTVAVRLDGTIGEDISAGMPVLLRPWPAVLFPDMPKGAEQSFPSVARAQKALSDAAVAFGRRAAGLPPLA